MRQVRPNPLRRCPACGGMKPERMLVCRACWSAAPGELKRTWFAAAASGDRLARVASARGLLAWARGVRAGGGRQ